VFDSHRLNLDTFVGKSDAFPRGMQRWIVPIWVALLLTGSTGVAEAQARGDLKVSAVVQSSATWLQGEDGRWILIVANAPDSKETFVALHLEKVATDSRNQDPCNAVAAPKSIPARYQKGKIRACKH